MTLMWIIIIIAVALGAAAGFAYLVSRIRKFRFVDRLSKGKKWASILISLCIVLFGAVFFTLAMGYVNMCVILITLTLIWLLTDIVIRIIRRFTDKRIKFDGYINGIIAVSAAIIYLAVGMFLDHHVFVTEYTITTDKAVEPLKIVMFADAHLGTTFDGEGFLKQVEKINSLDPDVVLIPGDFIDGSSRLSDLEIAGEALSGIDSRYGVYFSYGNHDQNVYGEDQRRNFTVDDLNSIFKENKVTVLDDESLEFADGYVVIGRKDATEPGRRSSAELMAEVNEDDFVIEMDHQPNDYDNEAKSGADLVVSGHTHGGQFFPINDLGVWMGVNDRTYGHEKREDTDFIVTSGISDWAVDFKTGCKSEIVVINIVPKNR